MKGRNIAGFVAVGLAAGLVLGSLGVATAATSSRTTTSRTTTASADTTAGPVGRGPGGPDGRGGHAGRGGGVLGEALAELTNSDIAAIMDKRAAGTSFADQAKAAGVSTAALLAKATELEKAHLDQAVADGRLTDAQRDEIVTGLKAHLTEELTETHEIGRPGGGRGGHGGRGHGRFPGSGTPTGSPSGADTTTGTGATTY